MATPTEIKQGITIHKPDKCDPSYVLYNSRMLETANLIDLDGTLVHSWSYPQGESWHYAEILPNGHLAAIVKEQEGQSPGMLLELDWESNLVRRFDVAAHHDFEWLENGNVIVLCREYVDNPAIYLPTEADPAPNTKSDVYLEITPDDEVVWEWHADEHALSLLDYVQVDYPRTQRDWAHTNTIEVLPDNPAGRADPRFAKGNVVFSMRHTDTIGVIDKATGTVAWAWGPGTIEKQHMPTMLDNGHFLVYDNGCETGRTRVIEMDPLSGEIVWQYVADPPESFFSFARGSNQRLSNGNTHIADSDNGRLLEVTPEGEIVWEFLNPDLTPRGRSQPLYRSMRYSHAFVARFL
jgi:outer membrane protein assembly factor BamB